MGLDNVAVQWPRTGRFYEGAPTEAFKDFGEPDRGEPALAGPAAALARHIAQTATARVTSYRELVDLMLGLTGVLDAATDASAEDEDPVIDPDGCAWIAGGLDRFVSGHTDLSAEVTFDSVHTVLRNAVAGTRLAEQQLSWLASRMSSFLDDQGNPPHWSYSLTEFEVLALFYRRCAERGFAVLAQW